MTTTRISDRDALELAHGRVPARADLNEVADLLTEYRRAAIGSAPRPSATLTARLDLSSTPIAMQRDGRADGTSVLAGRRAASGLLGVGLAVTIILGAASGAAAVVGAGSAGLLPPGAQDAFNQVGSFVAPGVAEQKTTDEGEAPGAAVPENTSSTNEPKVTTVETAVPIAPATTAPSTAPNNNGNGNSENSNGKAGTDNSGSNGNGTPNNNGNGNSENSNGNAGSGSSNSGNGNSEKPEKAEKPEKTENGNSGKGSTP